MYTESIMVSMCKALACTRLHVISMSGIVKMKTNNDRKEGCNFQRSIFESVQVALVKIPNGSQSSEHKCNTSNTYKRIKLLLDYRHKVSPVHRTLPSQSSASHFAA